MKKNLPIQVGMLVRPRQQVRRPYWLFTPRLVYFWSGPGEVTKARFIDACVNTIGAVVTGLGLVGCIAQALLK